MLRSTEIPAALVALSTHDAVSWPAMVSVCQVRADRNSSAARATRRDGLLSEVTASLLHAVCDAQPRRGSVFARQLCRHIPRDRDLGQWFCVPPFRVVCPYRVVKLSVPTLGDCKGAAVADGPQIVENNERS